MRKAFWLDLNEPVETISTHERLMFAADMNGHVGERINGDEECMGEHKLGRRNDEGQAEMNFAERMGLVITNTFFIKKQAHTITYSSVGRSTQVDYVMVRRRRIKEAVDAKVVAEKCVAMQHRMVVNTTIVWTKCRRAPKAVKKIRW